MSVRTANEKEGDAMIKPVGNVDWLRSGMISEMRNATEDMARKFPIEQVTTRDWKVALLL